MKWSLFNFNAHIISKLNITTAWIRISVGAILAFYTSHSVCQLYLIYWFFLQYSVYSTPLGVDSVWSFDWYHHHPRRTLKSNKLSRPNVNSSPLVWITKYRDDFYRRSTVDSIRRFSWLARGKVLKMEFFVFFSPKAFWGFFCLCC